MDYEKEILNKLIDIYEKREGFSRDISSMRAVQLDVRQTFSEYGNRYNHDVYREINVAIRRLRIDGLVFAEPNSIGQFSTVKLNISEILKCYKRVDRVSVPEKCKKVKRVLSDYADCKEPMLRIILDDWMELLNNNKKLPYDLHYNCSRTRNVINILQAIFNLDRETYIRNFSTAIFKDSKRFQREYRSTIESILFKYTDEVVEKSEILGFYNLYENPTYVFIKGNVVIEFGTSVINVSEMPDGIALSNASLENIGRVTVNADKVITVENLTTYHDFDETSAVHIYLGGYHNHTKQVLLEKIYEDNKNKEYFHEGDLDVYGFLILENLKKKTGIPFKPLMMDVKTLKKFYQAGLYKELTARDVKIIKEKKNTSLAAYEDVLQFMLDNNCKVEQESVKALELMG